MLCFKSSFGEGSLGCNRRRLILEYGTVLTSFLHRMVQVTQATRHNATMEHNFFIMLAATCVNWGLVVYLVVTADVPKVQEEMAITEDDPVPITQKERKKGHLRTTSWGREPPILLTDVDHPKTPKSHGLV